MLGVLQTFQSLTCHFTKLHESLYRHMGLHLNLKNNKTLSYRTNLSEGNTLAEAGIEKKQLDRACGDVRFRPRVLRSRGKIFDRSHPKSMLIPPQMLWNSTLPLSDHNIGESPLLQWALSELERRRGRGTPQITMLL